MIVECAKCGTKFRLDEARIGSRGAKVRCSKCSTAFVVYRPAAAIDGSVMSADATSLSPEEAGREERAISPAEPSASEPVPEQLSAPTGAEPDSAAGDDPNQVGTAVYHVAVELRADRKADPIPSLDLDVPSDSQAAGAFGFGTSDHSSVDLDADPDSTMAVPVRVGGLAVNPEVETPVDLPPFPAAPGGEENGGLQRAEPDDLPLADADLLDDLSEAKTGEPQADDAMAVPAWPPADSGVDNEDLLATPPMYSLQERLAAVDQAAAGMDGNGGPDEAQTTPANTNEGFGPTPLARIEPRQIDSKQVEPGTPARPVPSEGRGGLSVGVMMLMYVAVIAVVGAAVVLYLGGGRLDLSVIGLGKTGRMGPSLTGYQDVFPASFRSVLYPTASGRNVLVFVGTAENRSGELRQGIDVVAQLRATDGSVVASNRAPLGLALGPAEISSVSDQHSIDERFRALARERGEPAVAAGSSAPFTVVMLAPPSEPSDLQHTVRLEAGGPVLLPPPNVPKPLAEQELAGEPDSRKEKRKRKGKRRRGKRKAEAEK